MGLVTLFMQEKNYNPSVMLHYFIYLFMNGESRCLLSLVTWREQGEMKDFWSIKINQCLKTKIFCYFFPPSFFEICFFLQEVAPSEVPKPTVDQTRMVTANGVPVNAWIGSHLQPTLVLLSLPSGIITRAILDQSLLHSSKCFGVL